MGCVYTPTLLFEQSPKAQHNVLTFYPHSAFSNTPEASFLPLDCMIKKSYDKYLLINLKENKRRKRGIS